MHTGVRTAISDLEDRRTVLGKQAEDSESLVSEIGRERAVSKVPRDTWNLVGRKGDHPLRLNTT